MDVLVSLRLSGCYVFFAFSFGFGWGMACISPLVLVQPGLAWCTHGMYLIPEDIEGWELSGVLFACYLPNYLY
jgi:hypothetical protein